MGVMGFLAPMLWNAPVMAANWQAMRQQPQIRKDLGFLGGLNLPPSEYRGY
jgi:hypothetical protein